MQRALWLLGLVGCLGGDPDASERQPVALELGGEFDTITYHLTLQRPTAVGGIQTFTLRQRGTIPGIPGPPFQGKYRVETADARLHIEERQGTSITVRGLTSGLGVLRFLYSDGSPIDEVALSVYDVQRIALEPLSEFFPRDVRASDVQATVWGTGEQRFTVGLYQGTERLGDASMQVALSGAEVLGLDQVHVPEATVGIYPVSVTVGNQPPATVDFEVVDQADSASLITNDEPAPTSLVPNNVTPLCFQARSAGRYIMHPGWTFSIDGDVLPTPADYTNCVAVTPRQVSGAITVIAEALGQSVSLTLPVIPR